MDKGYGFENLIDGKKILNGQFFKSIINIKTFDFLFSKIAYRLETRGVSLNRVDLSLPNECL